MTVHYFACNYPTNLPGRRFRSSTLRIACRQLSAQKGLFNRPHISLDIKDFVTLHVVYYICVDSALLLILPYIFQVNAFGFAYTLCKIFWV